MPPHRLNIWRHGRLLGNFDSSTPWASEAVLDIAARLGEADGYRLELLVSKDERRVLESGLNGVRVLFSDPIFLPPTMKE